MLQALLYDKNGEYFQTILRVFSGCCKVAEWQILATGRDCAVFAGSSYVILDVLLKEVFSLSCDVSFLANLNEDGCLLFKVDFTALYTTLIKYAFELVILN